MNSQTQRSDKYWAIVGTVVVHGLLLLLFILLAFKTPIPPFPDAGTPGVEVAFGIDVEGMGTSDGIGKGDNPITDNVATPPVTQNVTDENDRVVTNDVEETVALKNEKKPKKEKTNKKNVVKPVEQERPKEPQPDNELAEALNKFKQAKGLQSGGHGESDKAGGLGDPNGEPGGEGSGGTGDHGTGKGKNGVSHTLKGRKIIHRPALMGDAHEEGRVVVEIVVDDNGKVKEAIPGARGTTTTSSVLWSKARQAAKETKFNPSADGVSEQRGTITFVFILN